MNAARLIEMLAQLGTTAERDALLEEHFDSLSQEDRGQVADWLREQSDPAEGSFGNLTLAGEFGRDFTAIESNEAVQIIADRLHHARTGSHIGERDGFWSMFGQPTLDHAEEMQMAAAIVESIPARWRREDLLRRGDLRPLLQAAVDDGTLDDEDGRVTEYQALVRDSMERRLWESAMMRAPSQELDPEGHALFIEENQLLIDELMNRANDGEIILTPEPADAEVPVEDSLDTAFNQFDIAASGGRRSEQFMTREEVAQMLQSGETDLLDVSGRERTMIAEAERRGVEIGGNRAHVWVDGEVRAPTAGNVGSGTDIDWGRAAGKEMYTITETLALPSSMSRSQVMRLSEQLRSAGMYTRVGAEPQVPGDATDPAFKRAWMELASMSMQRNQSMMSVLEERKGVYEDELLRSLGTELSDPARIRLQSDGLSRQVLGRKLSDEEHAEMVEFVHNLERRNAQIEAGLDPELGSDLDLDEGIVADIDARMAEMIRAENPVEAEAVDVADQYDTFSSLIRGPGRGGF